MKALTSKKTENRLDDLLRLAVASAVRTTSDRIDFELPYEDRESFTQAPAQVVSVCGPGDTAEPVITLIFPHEE